MVFFCCQCDESIVSSKRSKSVEREENKLRRSASPKPLRKGAQQVEVYLNVYSLLDINSKLKWLGLGVYHTGVVIYGLEWGYGEAVDCSNTTGIFYVMPGEAAGTFYRKIFLGVTTHSPEQVDSILHELEIEWQSCDYHLLKHNCNHFAERFCYLLSTVQKLHVPNWCNRAARVFSNVLPNWLLAYVHRVIDEEPPKAQLPSSSRANEAPVSVIPPYWYLYNSLSQEPHFLLSETQMEAEQAQNLQFENEYNNEKIQYQRQQQQQLLHSGQETTCAENNFVEQTEDGELFENFVSNGSFRFATFQNTQEMVHATHKDESLTRESSSEIIFLTTGSCKLAFGSVFDNDCCNINQGDFSVANPTDGYNVAITPNMMLAEKRELEVTREFTCVNESSGHYDATAMYIGNMENTTCMPYPVELQATTYGNQSKEIGLHDSCPQNDDVSAFFATATVGSTFNNDVCIGHIEEKDVDCHCDSANDVRCEDDGYEYYIVADSNDYHDYGYIYYDDANYANYGDKNTYCRKMVTTPEIVLPAGLWGIVSSDSAQNLLLETNCESSYGTKNTEDCSSKRISHQEGEKSLDVKIFTFSGTSDQKQVARLDDSFSLGAEGETNDKTLSIEEVYTDPNGYEEYAKPQKTEDKSYVNSPNTPKDMVTSKLLIRLITKGNKITTELINPLRCLNKNDTLREHRTRSLP